jgi:hypothetical protein
MYEQVNGGSSSSSMAQRPPQTPSMSKKRDPGQRPSSPVLQGKQRQVKEESPEPELDEVSHSRPGIRGRNKG